MLTRKNKYFNKLLLNWVLNVSCLFWLYLVYKLGIYCSGTTKCNSENVLEYYVIITSFHHVLINNLSFYIHRIPLYFLSQVKHPLCSRILKLSGFFFFLRFKETTRSFSNECLGPTRPVTPIDSSDFALDIRMPGVTPKQVRGILHVITHLFMYSL